MFSEETQKWFRYAALAMVFISMVGVYLLNQQMNDIKEKGLQDCIVFEQVIPKLQNCTASGGLFTYQCIPGSWTGLNGTRRG